MYRLLFMLILSLIVSSCARVLNSEDKYISIHTPEPSQIIYGQDTFPTVDNRVVLKVPRQKAPVNIEVETDSLSKDVDIYSSDSFLYWGNVYLTYGIGILFDIRHPRRYKYPEDIYLDTSDALNSYSIFGESKFKGRLYFHGSVSVMNHFLYKSNSYSYQRDESILGMSLGGDYYYSENRFLHTDVSFLLGFDFTKSAFLEETDDDFGAITFSFSHQFKKERWSYGLGVSYRDNFIYDTNRFRDYSSLGLNFPFHFQLSNYWHVGLVYNPTFYRPELVNQWAYDHTINIEFVCKVRVDY